MDATLLEMVKEVRWKTLKLLEGVDDAQARWTPVGLANSILWNAGHAVVVAEKLAFEHAAGRAVEYPAGWFEMFSWESKPATVTQWPTVGEMVEVLRGQRERLTALVGGMSEAALDEVIGPAPRNRTRRGVIVHALHDEAGHGGEMYLMKKLWKLRVGG